MTGFCEKGLVRISCEATASITGRNEGGDSLRVRLAGRGVGTPGEKALHQFLGRGRAEDGGGDVRHVPRVAGRGLEASTVRPFSEFGFQEEAEPHERACGHAPALKEPRMPPRARASRPRQTLNPRPPPLPAPGRRRLHPARAPSAPRRWSSSGHRGSPNCWWRRPRVTRHWPARCAWPSLGRTAAVAWRLRWRNGCAPSGARGGSLSGVRCAPLPAGSVGVRARVPRLASGGRCR